MRIYVKVVPKSSRNKIEKISEEEYKAWITAPPVDGKANTMLTKVLSEYLGVPKGFVEIIGGKTSRIKIVDILKK
jgi:uncharacterized protein (TIGR00251 family)